MSLFITVGSTGFDGLISQVTSQEFLTSLVLFGITKVRVQYGSSESIFIKNIQRYDGPRIDIMGYNYKASITEDMEDAEIIVSHAGSGTVLQSLRLNKKLIVIVNTTLMDNHQNQIAQVMETKNYAVSSDINDLLNTIQRVKKTSFEKFPSAKQETFAAIVDDQMGF